MRQMSDCCWFGNMLYRLFISISPIKPSWNSCEEALQTRPLSDRTLVKRCWKQQLVATHVHAFHVQLSRSIKDPWRSGGWLKGIVHLKMKILSFITHPHDVPNPQDLRSSSEHILRYFWWNLRAFWPYRNQGSYHVQGPERYQKHLQNSPCAISLTVILWSYENTVCAQKTKIMTFNHADVMVLSIMVVDGNSGGEELLNKVVILFSHGQFCQFSWNLSGPWMW